MTTTRSNKKLICIVGPTAVGKTQLAIDLAKKLNTVIISADSRQFYRELNIGTAKPSPEDLNAVPHYFINSHSIQEEFSAGDFEKACLELLKDLFTKKDEVILVGGSGLFVNAICEGLDDLPFIPSELREKWNNIYQNKGIEALKEHLKNVDPNYYEQVDKANPQRLIRAIEVFEATGKPYSEYRIKNTSSRPFNCIKFALNRDRDELYHRINSRVDIMMKEGLLEEVKGLVEFKNLRNLLTVGYSELFDYFDGKHSNLEEAVDKIKQNSRRYAKRQITWFKKDTNTVWLDASKSTQDLLTEIENTLKRK